MRRVWLLPFLASFVLPAAAQADDDDDWEAKRDAQARKEAFEALARDLPVVTPEAGLDKATAQAPPWCDGVEVSDGYSPSSLPRTIESAAKTDWRGYLNAAEITCSFPKEPSVHKAVAVIVQSWINLTNLSQADAIESLKMRMKAAKLEADRAKLCDALVVSDEVEGEEKAFMRARQALFGCGNAGQAMWLDTDIHVPDDLLTYLDNSDTEVDEMVRLAAVTDHSRFALYEEGRNLELSLLTYVWDQLDYQTLSAQKVTALLDGEPYKKNAYARLIVMESLGRARRGMAAIDALVKKKSSDADWKELLVTAPQRGIAAWNQAAGKWKEQIARSNEFEHKFWGPSRKAVKGCWAKLRPDFLTVAAGLDKSSAKGFEQAISDPVASLLFSRLALCAAVDHPDKHYADQLVAIMRDVRYSRGPRLAAYYAALDAIGQIREDRTKFPITPQDLWFPKDRALYDEALAAANKDQNGMGFVVDELEGVVKSVKKSANGVVITFATNKVQVMGRECVETNKILTYRADGSPLYLQNCRDTGMITVDRTPDDVSVAAEWTDGIKAGAVVQFSTGGGDSPRPALPTAVYADKSKKKLVNYYGLGL